MKRKKSAHHKAYPKPHNSLRLVVTFTLVVLLLIVVSLSVKFVNLVKTSTYDNQRFTIAVHDRTGLRLYSFDPENDSASIINFTDKVPAEKRNQVLGIIVDKTLRTDADVSSYKSPKSFLGFLLLQPYKFDPAVNYYDLIRLYLFSRTIKDHDIKEASVSVAQEEEIDRIVSQLFIDSKIVSENKSIAIVNGTGESGVGRRLERVLINAGANVISVTTARDVVKKSSMTYQADSYTLKKIASYLNYTTIQAPSKDISDILITVGEDSLKTTKF